MMDNVKVLTLADASRTNYRAVIKHEGIQKLIIVGSGCGSTHIWASIQTLPMLQLVVFYFLMFVVF